MYFVNVLLYLICQYFVQDFCICIHQRYWSVIFFFVCYSCQILVLELCCSYKMNQEGLPLQFFWKNLRRIGFKSYLNVWQDLLVKLSGPGLLGLGRFFMVASISSLLIGLFRFFNSLWFSLGRLYISRNLPVYSRLLNLVAYSLSQYSGMILCISVMSVLLLFHF